MNRCRALAVVVGLACLVALPAVAQPPGGKQLFNGKFDPKDWRTVERDDQGKEGLVLEVSFKLERTAEGEANPGQFRIVIEEDGKRVKEQSLTTLSESLTAVLAVDISNSMELIDNEA